MLSHCLGPLPHCIRQSRHLGRKLLSARLVHSVLDFLLVPFPPDPAPGQPVQMPALWHSQTHTAPVCLKICFSRLCADMDYAVKRHRPSFAAGRTNGAMSSFPKAVSTRSVIAAAWLSDAMLICKVVLTGLFDKIKASGQTTGDKITATRMQVSDGPVEPWSVL